jgi:2-polyprenyl-6-methoxyphenol hydroxylase-like FAD-dependent oxidoreductase
MSTTLDSAARHEHAEDDVIYDVVQIGYGPVGQANAALLGQRGHRVAVFERHASLFGLSRAGHMDHEIMRILQSIDCSDTMERESVSPDNYDLVNADHQLLIRYPWLKGISGFRTAYLFYQPVLETALDNRVRSLPNVEVTQGWEAVAVDQQPDHVAVTVQPKGSDGSTQRIVRGRYLVAADGGSSFVRQALGQTMRDLGFSRGWLVIDFLNKRPINLPFQNGQICDPARPTSIFEMGPAHSRFSFAAVPGDTEEFLLRPQTAWDLVGEWITPDDAQLIRQAYYVLEAKVLDELRYGSNVFFIGDTAHVMPPFLGQGMCSGLRDAANLSWKLDLVLRGLAGDELLDSYTPERQPHAERYVELSMELAKLMCLSDPDDVRRRDESFRQGNAPAMKPFPWIETGVLQTSPPATLESVIGRLGPQGAIELDGRTGRADDVLGSGWQIINRRDNVLDECGPESRELLDTLGVQVLQFGPDGARDVDGVYDKFLSDAGVDTIVVRPDFYVFGGLEAGGDINTILDDLRGQLFDRAHGDSLVGGAVASGSEV